jgi:hypothetical protein
MQDGFRAETDSIDGSAHLLMEIAGLLYQGRMDGENATACRSPRSHYQVAIAVTNFARFSQNQYNDVVGILAALSTKLSAAGNGYVRVDDTIRKDMDSLLDSGLYVPAEGR